MLKFLLFLSLLSAVTVKPHTTILKNPPAVKKVYHRIYHITVDSSKLNLHAYNGAALKKLRIDPAFSYDEKAKTGLNLWDRFWIWFWELIARLFSGGEKTASNFSIPYMQYFVAALALALLIYLIVKMAGLNIANIFNRKSREITIPYSESLENIHQITFDEEIEKALNQHNYRLAVRLLYLRTLKQLSDAGLINWQLEKTNSAYINELADSDQKQSFGILTRQFEYVWYGDFPVDGRSFQNINTLFHDFKTRLK